MTKIIDEVCKDYTLKLQNKNLAELDADGINSLVSLLNFSFKTQNNFFIEKFNKKMIKQVNLVYNQLKTNILSQEIDNILYNIHEDDIKLLRYIVINFVNNFEIIEKTESELCLKINREIMKNLIYGLSKNLN